MRPEKTLGRYLELALPNTKLENIENKPKTGGGRSLFYNYCLHSLLVKIVPKPINGKTLSGSKRDASSECPCLVLPYEGYEFAILEVLSIASERRLIANTLKNLKVSIDFVFAKILLITGMSKRSPKYGTEWYMRKYQDARVIWMDRARDDGRAYHFVRFQTHFYSRTVGANDHNRVNMLLLGDESRDNARRSENTIIRL